VIVGLIILMIGASFMIFGLGFTSFSHREWFNKMPWSFLWAVVGIAIALFMMGFLFGGAGQSANI
jgi:uncharacterized membrane protein YkvI